MLFCAFEFITSHSVQVFAPHPFMSYGSVTSFTLLIVLLSNYVLMQGWMLCILFWPFVWFAPWHPMSSGMTGEPLTLSWNSLSRVLWYNLTAINAACKLNRGSILTRSVLCSMLKLLFNCWAYSSHKIVPKRSLRPELMP